MISNISNVILYVFAFLSVYVQVFLLITFLEKRKKVILRNGPTKLEGYPAVTVIVPCYNESKTIEKTAFSLLGLDYPKEKLKIILVDDGSRDNTWEIMQEFKKFGNVTLLRQENGGKHTALNLGLRHTETEFVGCLDADSFVDPQALGRIMSYFEVSPEVMAVAPSIVVHEPKNILQNAQKAEYEMAVYVKKMLGFIGGIHVTPGPFSIFRKKVFDDLGPYRSAHNTEDQEIALRMQTHGYKIEHCPDAYVYTVSPNTVGKLYRQRQRWIYGFIKNALDYKHLFFKKKYGNVALFTLPSGFVSVLSVIFLFVFMIYNFSSFIYGKVTQAQAAGLSLAGQTHFEWFFVSTRAFIFISVILYSMVIASLLLGRRMSTERRAKITPNVFYFFIIYTILAPFWLLKAIWNAALGRQASWTLERKV